MRRLESTTANAEQTPATINTTSSVALYMAEPKIDAAGVSEVSTCSSGTVTGSLLKNMDEVGVRIA